MWKKAFSQLLEVNENCDMIWWSSVEHELSWSRCTIFVHVSQSKMV